jgi:uncharacterized SAM-binding protein YcdF (DUF218 family)
MITLSKLLPLLISPLVFLVALAIVGALFKKRWLVVVPLLVLWVISLPIVADPIWRALERHEVARDPASLPTADAIVVLGGMAREVPGAGSQTHREWAEAADRFWGGWELFRLGKAPKLIFTGGRVPWSVGQDNEGQWLKRQALRLGVPASAIVVTEDVENTAQEAKAVAGMFPKGNIILVTSAFHMPRARALFEKEGLRVSVFAVDFQVGLRKPTPMDYLPSVEALRLTSQAFREWLGRLVYGGR